MKLKLFFLSIIALLSLVAYQKYSEYSALKFIDSYESCVTAKGSLIQESYPATCITRLGSRFTQPISPSTEQTPKDFYKEFTFDLISGLYRDVNTLNPVSYLNYQVANNLSKPNFQQVRDSGKLKIEIYVKEDSISLDEFYNNYHKDSYGEKVISKKDTKLDGERAVLEEVESQMGGNTSFVFVKNPHNGHLYHIVFGLDFNSFDDIRDQILGSFKFTN